MNIEEVMKRHGFRFSASCGGQASYTRFVKYKGKRAYINLTDVSGEGFPRTLDDPVQVRIYDVRSGDELEVSQNISALSTYLKSLNV
jgi:hypothetical protein